MRGKQTASAASRPESSVWAALQAVTSTRRWKEHYRSETEKKKGYLSVHSQCLYRVFARTARVACSFQRGVSPALLFLRQHPFLSSGPV